MYNVTVAESMMECSKGLGNRPVQAYIRPLPYGMVLFLRHLIWLCFIIQLFVFHLLFLVILIAIALTPSMYNEVIYL
jgi:hypothetical protein